VDAGTDDRAARWLRRNGHRHVDLLVLTHPHVDHIGGAADVLRRISVGQLWMMSYDDDGPVARRVRQTATQRGVPIHAPPVFHTVTLGMMHIEVLNPPPGRIYRGTTSEWNNESIVLRIVTENGTLLLLSDTEAPAHYTLLASGMNLTADVVTVPHHGSSTTDLAVFSAVGAHTAVISVGADNPYGHPHREIVAELSARQTRIVRTDVNGTVRIVVSPTPQTAKTGTRLMRSAA
jgi:competence protein ComEC